MEFQVVHQIIIKKEIIGKNIHFHRSITNPSVSIGEKRTPRFPLETRLFTVLNGKIVKTPENNN